MKFKANDYVIVRQDAKQFDIFYFNPLMKKYKGKIYKVLYGEERFGRVHYLLELDDGAK